MGPVHRFLVAAAAIAATAGLLAGCQLQVPAAPAGGSIEEGADMRAIEAGVVQEIPGARASAAVLMSGLTRHLDVSIHAASAPSPAQVRGALAVVAEALPGGVSAVDFVVSDEDHAPIDMTPVYRELGFADAAISEFGSRITSYDLGWFQEEFGA